MPATPASPGDPLVLAVTSLPADGDSAAAFAKSLVQSRLAACVHILPPGRSFYHWDGRLNDDPESLLLIKTAKSSLPALEHFLKTRHPYQVPEFFAIEASHVSPPYLNWVLQETAATPQNPASPQ